MRSQLYIWALCLSVVLGGILVFGITRQGHDFAGRCEQCHLHIPEEGEDGLLVRDVDYLCLNCHVLSESNSHPTEVKPSMEVPEVFPLDWMGRITCNSCHDPHVEDTLENPDLLRSAARGESFCFLCHQEIIPQEGKHFSVSQIAHNKRRTQPDRDSLGNLDKVSLECLSCHDGIIGPESSYWLADQPPLTFRGRSLSHPIGIDYAEASAKNRELKPMETLSSLVSLYEGMVGCGSCHNPYSQQHDMLVFSNRRSALCLECHLM